ncbi:MAG: peptidase Ste24p [Actinomycetia bacterium]|nr:peptidase Ste24p [Actinomycetes bacterium]
MHLAVYLPLLVPLAAALSAGRLARRLDPRLATWLLTGSAVALAAATATVLSLLVVAGLIQIPLIAQLGRLSQQVIQQDNAPSTTVALLSAVALSAAFAAAARMTWRRVRVLLAAAVQARHLPGTGEVVIMEDDGVAEAFTVPGRPGRIVVSTGMLTALTETEREALLAHERAHLRSHHHWFTAAAQLAAAANPLLRPLARAVAFTIERWADEDAATACGDRRLVARTIARASLAKAAAARSGTAAPSRATSFALGVTGDPADLADLSSAGPVPRRVAALLAAPPQRRLILVIAVAAVLAATGVCTLEALRDLHDLLETASV